MAQSKTDIPKVPSGWKAIFDDEYQTWFYVDLSTKKSQWDEPKGTTWPSREAQRPSGPPPPPGYSRQDPSQTRSQQPYVPQQQSQQPYVPQQQPQPQPVRYAPQPQMAPQPMYYPQQPVYQQPQQNRGRTSSMMSPMMGVGAGLLGGALLSNMFESHHPDTIVENNYYNDDNNNDNYDGGDFGGGDFGGGDFGGGDFGGGDW
ncbi:Wwm1p NDAI_0C06380 [Naumovozyma dairenensis CBS 421]|uniref:WW domain-containing protein n=1 Tax=Naumovozyma dairenensis (strain ATCC 10597 / BCRC 20456 / CBS 421 / NBRC 0211 / NRRL Y-12639) TaxID=1071378 RepID=G0W936_NAUDC|nr:hypothetical protein NDAI_0C06380 [Naumovozyma dairenensis CBS 421]CCD24297.1 hypothetical protein NDAI_0C06380 [Naumovozyma dairenensis CBS 421]